MLSKIYTVLKIKSGIKVCMVIGYPIKHTLSPIMHNAAYKALNIVDKFIFVASEVEMPNFKKAIEAIRIFGIKGISCTMPYKQEVIKYIDEIDPIAKKIGAVNTVVNKKGILKGYNTDWLGAIIPLEKITSLKNKKVALIGAGGVARAIAYGVVNKGAKLNIYNRTKEKAVRLANEFGGYGSSLDNLKSIQNADIIINATPVGMYPEVLNTPLSKRYIRKKHIILDSVYIPYKTRLLKEAEEVGATIIPGLEMFLYQGIAQFELYTKYKAPEEIMRKTLIKYLNFNK